MVLSLMGRYVLDFEEIDQMQVAFVGGKGAHLGGDSDAMNLIQLLFAAAGAGAVAVGVLRYCRASRSTATAARAGMIPKPLRSERRVAQLAAEGLSNREVAERL